MWVCAWSRAILRVCFELEACCFTALSITDWLSTCANRHTQKFHAVKKSKRTVLKPNQILWTILCLHLFPKNHTCRHENSQCVHLEKNVTKMCIYEDSASWCIIEDAFLCEIFYTNLYISSFTTVYIWAQLCLVSPLEQIISACPSHKTVEPHIFILHQHSTPPARISQGLILQQAS